MALGKYSAGLKLVVRMAVALLVVIPAWGASLSVRVVDPAGSPVSDAVVYAMAKSRVHSSARSTKSVSIEQRDREFVPYVSVVQTGTTVNFPNRDPLLHHVYSFSPAKSFEIKLYSGDAPRSIQFDKPGTVTLGCNIHDWMIGYVLVVDTPLFGKTAKDGQMQINDLPAGEFEIFVWHPTQRAGVEPKPYRFDARSSAEFTFTVDAAPRTKRFKPPLDGLRYK